MLELVANPLLNPQRTIASVEAEIALLPHLAGDRRLLVRHARRRAEDARKAKTAAESIGQLPKSDEAVHIAISGRFALYHFVPAIIDLAGQRAAEVWIATLGFSRRNVDDIAGMLDDGRIGHLWLLASHYFSQTSAEVFEHAGEALGQRSDRAMFLSARTHAKLLLLMLDDGRTFTIESSANLRSCKNIEQATVIGDPIVFNFHRQWINELFSRGGEL